MMQIYSNRFEIDFASNEVLGLVKFIMTIEKFVVELKVSKRAFDYDIPQMTRTRV